MTVEQIVAEIKRRQEELIKENPGMEMKPIDAFLFHQLAELRSFIQSDAPAEGEKHE